MMHISAKWLIIVATLTACSGRPKVTPAEDCGAVGDEDGNGLADCDDPACASVSACQPVCGNGKIETGEQCDDGNSIDDDDCKNDCTLPVCGNHMLESDEQCDDGHTIHGCDNRCTLAPIVYFKSSNISGLFGISVALSADGSTLAVGAAWENSAATGVNGDQTDTSAPQSGAVYVFTRSGATWVQQAYIKASNTDAGDQFGRSVALSGDGSTLAVTAIFEASAATGIDGDQADNSAIDAGAVYVFARSGTTWTQQAYVKASNTDPEDAFGWSIALSADGDTLAVGSGESSDATGINGDQTNNGTPVAGAVYVFTRSGITWAQQAYIKASNTPSPSFEAGDLFGQSVALSADGSTLAVGATLEDSNATDVDGDQTDNSAQEAGAVYVFTRSGTTWAQQSYIKASNTEAGDLFGHSVALSADGSTLAVSAVSEDSGAVEINGNQADNSMSDSGAVYVYTRTGTTWARQAYVKPFNTGAGDEFGWSLALSADGSSLAVGAWLEDSAARGVDGDQSDESGKDSGAVYVFTRRGAIWIQDAYVKASNTHVFGSSSNYTGDQFGISVALSADGSSLAVGAYFEESAATGIDGDQTDTSAGGRGAAYLFQ